MELAQSAPAPSFHTLAAPLPVDRENYARFDDTGWMAVAEKPVSTFSIDVDTGSYSNMRRMLNEGRLPPMDAVRAEELINYFDYDCAVEAADGRPFTVTAEVGPSPWNPHTRLLHVGIRGVDADAAAPKAANLEFLVDVSGSTRLPDKLDLLKSALKLLVGQLGAHDRISLVVYAGASASTPISGSVRFDAVAGDLQSTTTRYRFCAAVTAFDYAAVLELARGDDPFGYRGEFLSLVALAASQEVQSLHASN